MDEYDTVFAEYKKRFIDDVLNSMTGLLDNHQLSELNKSLNKHTNDLNIKDNPKYEIDCDATNEELINKFINEKELMGCSDRTSGYYKSTLTKLNEWSVKPFTELTTQDIRDYFKFHQNLHNCSNTTIDNVRRVFSSFYTYLIEEEYVLDSPMRKIPAIKQRKSVKEPFTTEEIILMRNAIIYDSKNSRKCKKINKNKERDLAIFELLLSSGIRIGEAVKLNRTSIDFVTNSFIVTGKGNKQRTCYMNTQANIALKNYLKTRTDDNVALFVNSQKPHNRLGHNGIERLIRDYGESVGVEAYPHKFRRTFATNALRKGTPLEQVSTFLGHSNIDTTLIYAIVDQDELKINHEKYMEF